LTDRAFHTALIVEPTLVGSRQLRQVALSVGFERVLLTEDGPQAVTVMGEELVDVVFTPWEAGSLSGVGLLRALRKLARNRRVPVVLLDGGLHQQVIVAAVKAGVAGRLQLPPQAEQLREILSVISAGGPAPGHLLPNKTPS
jgi:CheY-like chemotaxis protein